MAAQVGAPPSNAVQSPRGARIRRVMSVRSCDCGIQGPENLILTLAQQLAARGIRYASVNLWDGFPPRVELHAHALRLGLETSILRGAWGLDPRVVARLRSVIRTFQPDVVETHDVKSQTFALLATRGLGVPLVGHFYGQLVSRSLWLKAQELSSFLTLRAFDRVLANSRAQQAELLRAGFSTQRVGVLPSFVDTRSLAPPDGAEAAAARSRLGIEPGQVVLATVARLSPNKGHIHLLRALPAIRTVVPEVVYLAAGEGESQWRGEGGDLEQLQRAANELGVPGAVRFLGYYPDVRTVLHAADLVVSPSLREGMQVSLLEAMAAGRPIVATAVGGTPDAVADRVTGLLVPPADPPALARAVLALVGDRARLERMGAAARRRAVEHFDAAVVAEQFVRCCAEVAARG